LKTWGYILQGPGRPSLRKQREILRALGVEVDIDYPPVWHDKIERGASGKKPGERQLDERNALLLAVQSGDKVVVSVPLCLGLSRKDAAWFISELASRGAALAVSNNAWFISPGADAESLLEEVARQQNTANVTAYRARKSGRSTRLPNTKTAAGDEEDEIWRDIDGHSGYQVSSLGRIKSVDRQVLARRGGTVRTVSLIGKILRPRRLPNGYLRASLGAGSDEYIHRLVLLAFVGDCPLGMECAHDDGDRSNNKLSNLEWKTPSANGLDKRRHGTALFGAKNPAWAGPKCRNGHAYTKENTRLQKRGDHTIRICRTCAREHARQVRAEMKLQS
jgi:hypothetical protein